MSTARLAAAGFGPGALGVVERALGALGELLVGRDAPVVVALEALEAGLRLVALRLEGGLELAGLLAVCGGVRDLGALHPDDLVVVVLDVAAVGQLVGLLLRLLLEVGEGLSGLGVGALGARDLAHGGDAVGHRAAADLGDRAGRADEVEVGGAALGRRLALVRGLRGLVGLCRRGLLLRVVTVGAGRVGVVLRLGSSIFPVGLGCVGVGLRHGLFRLGHGLFRFARAVERFRCGIGHLRLGVDDALRSGLGGGGLCLFLDRGILRLERVPFGWPDPFYLLGLRLVRNLAPLGRLVHDPSLPLSLCSPTLCTLARTPMS